MTPRSPPDFDDVAGRDGSTPPTLGVSESGRGASGRSNSSLPRSSAKVRSRGRSRSKTSPSPVRPDQVPASFTLAGPNAAR